MEGQQRPFPLTTAEEIAVEYSDILDRVIDLNKKLISELAQYRRMDEEEQILERCIIQMNRAGGGTHGN